MIITLIEKVMLFILTIIIVSAMFIGLFRGLKALIQKYDFSSGTCMFLLLVIGALCCATGHTMLACGDYLIKEHNENSTTENNESVSENITHATTPVTTCTITTTYTVTT